MSLNFLKKGIGVVGSTTIDKINVGDYSCFKLGGVTTYAGITYRRHGLAVIAISNMAEQDLKILNKLQSEGILISCAKSDLSTYFVNHTMGDICCQELLQQAEPIKFEQIQSNVDRVDGLHLGPLHPLDFEVGALKSLQDSNLRIFLDVQGYTRKVINKKVYCSVSDQMSAGLALAHIVKASEVEVKAILAYYRMTLTQLVRHFDIEEFVVTLGNKGGFVTRQNGKTFHFAADRVEVVLDPTGAGDVFLAAYIIQRWLDKNDILNACKYAAEIAAQQVQGNYIRQDFLGLDG